QDVGPDVATCEYDIVACSVFAFPEDLSTKLMKI
ncbi:hypothetical protein A2U01_0046580, partial [Trifolium medium]|nr:hypothetical protein [Trifolium medium]